MTKPYARPRGTLIAAIDIGTTKVCCFIARREPTGPRILGIGHQVSRGVRAGQINDLDAAATSMLNAVHAAEQMAGETITEVILNLSGGFPPSRIVPVEMVLGGREIGDAEMKKVLGQGHAYRDAADRQIIHSVPVGFSIDGSRGIRDPRGMVGDKLGINMHIVSASSAAVRNTIAAVGRCHLEVAGIVVSPYAAGLSALVEDEMQLGATLIDMGGGTTTIGVFYDGAIVYADTVPVGGGHVTNDIARGLSTPISHAERMKTLFGCAIPSPSDERETITVPVVGEGEDGQPNQVPKSHLIGIISPRLEETFELVRNRLEASGFDKLAGRQVVLTGGASQLPGTRELAGMILDKQVRIGRPTRIAGLAEATGGPAFATTVGLLHFAASERAESRGRDLNPAALPKGMLGRVGHWLRDNL
ncbi:MAG: cell division protein FtsA [Aliidongia sp.]|jgi:cell division protein FtsA|nr:cell division protein FtsA [Aliidongia sp.]